MSIPSPAPGEPGARDALELPPGPWDPTATDALALVVVRGLVVREIHLTTSPATELLGPGDLVVPAPAEQRGPGPAVTWRAALPTRIAVIGPEHLAGPGGARVATTLLAHTTAQLHRTSVHAAICRLPRVEDRVLALLWLLADRWGRVGAEGVVVPISLTHEALGRLVGARRPTVSIALKGLTAREALSRRRDGTWVLRRPFGA